jgi:hypothetical protein
MEAPDPLKMMCQNVDILLDGLGWKPLSKDMDGNAVDLRIHREIFPEAAWFKPK